MQLLLELEEFFVLRSCLLAEGFLVLYLLKLLVDGFNVILKLGDLLLVVANFHVFL